MEELLWRAACSIRGEKDAPKFKEIEALYEIISPDPFLRDFMDDYGALAKLFQIVHNAFALGKAPGLYSEVARKTAALVRESVTAEGFDNVLPVVKIDEKALEALKRPDPSPAKVINLSRSLIQAIAAGGDEEPFLVPIGDRVEALLERYEDRQLSTEDAIHELEKLTSEFIQARKERRQAGLDTNTFSIYWLLRQARVEKPEALAPALDGAIRKFPQHAHQPGQLRQLKAELYRVLLPAVGKERMVEVAEQILRLRRS